MLRNVVGKVLWVGRTASMVFGLALVMALVLGVASMAFGANGDFFKVGRANVASAVSTLTKSGAGPALSLRVGSGPPLAVNSPTRVANLNADRLDGKDISAFDAKEVLDSFGPLPIQGTYTSKGGTLVISSSGSGFRSLASAQKPGEIGMRVFIDDSFVDDVPITVNQRDIRHSFVADTAVMEDLPAGEHTIRLVALYDSTCNTASESPFNYCTTTNRDDRFNVTVVEIPD